MKQLRNHYHFDYIKAYGTNMENVDVVFPLNDVETIEINGKHQRAYCGHVGESGMSSDYLYYRVHLADYTFWVDPADFDDLMEFLEDRRTAAIQLVKQHQEERVEYNRRHANQLLSGVKSDPITDEIYRCYIHGTPTTALQAKFPKLIAAISEKCEQHDGKLYKTAAKGANYAIEAQLCNYTDDHFDYLRKKGHKVVTLEQAVEYMGLQRLWDCTKVRADLRAYAHSLVNTSQGKDDYHTTVQNSDAAQHKNERVKYPPRRPIAYTPRGTNQPENSDTSSTSNDTLYGIIGILIIVLIGYGIYKLFF